MTWTSVEGGKKENKVVLYALSTCGWCKKTKKLLNDSSVEYEYLDVDIASSEERRGAIEELKKRNVPLGFPVTIIDDDKIIIGFKPDEFKEALGL